VCFVFGVDSRPDRPVLSLETVVPLLELGQLP
jgi:hypothetical protein